jgi:CPA2 family monovalent cation:H+ antiporter-2
MLETVLASSGSSNEARAVVLDILLTLAAAALVTMGLRRLKLQTIPGYLITGALIGPSALGVVQSDANVRQITDLAVILLMFTIGLHLDLSALARGLLSIIIAGVASTLAVVGLLWPVAVAFGLHPAPALVVAMAMSMSSTAVVLRLLAQKRETHRMHGRLCVGVSIVQDMLSLVMLALMPLLAKWGGAALAAPVADATRDSGGIVALLQDAGLKVGGIALMILIGRFVLPGLMREAAREKSGESVLVLSAAVALGAAVFAAFLGFSPELGAFLAGFLLASTPFRYQLAGQLSPMRDLFLALFFTAVGLKLSIPEVLANWWVVLIALPVVVVVKALAIAASCWAAGSSAPVAVRTGLALAQAGEFSIVVLTIGVAAGALPDKLMPVPIALVVLSLVAAPTLYDLGARLAERTANWPLARWFTHSALREGASAPLPDAAQPETDPAPAETDPAAPTTPADGSAPTPAHAQAAKKQPPQSTKRVIIAGFGVVGRAVADHLEVNGIPYTVVELNASTVQTQTSLGRRVVFGDIGNPDVLESAGILDADAIFLTVPDDEAMLRACQAVRRAAPSVRIVARTNYLSTAFQAHAAGADDVAVSEVATAEAMAKKVISRLMKDR